MEAVVRGHAWISQIVLDTGASKDLVLDTGAGKDLDSIVARDERDLPEVGFVGMHDSEDRVSTSRTGSRFSTGRWQGAAGGWRRLSGPVSSCLFTCNNVLMFFCFGNRWVVLNYQSKTAFILTTESGRAVLAATAGHFAVVRGSRRHGYNVLASCPGGTALMQAISCRHRQLVQLLLELCAPASHGADDNIASVAHVVVLFPRSGRTSRVHEFDSRLVESGQLHYKRCFTQLIVLIIL